MPRPRQRPLPRSLMVWFILAGMAAFAALAAIWPVLHSSSAPADADAASSEAAFYKAQIDEI